MAERDPKTGRFPKGNGAGKGDGWGGPAKGAGGPPIKPGDPEGIQRMSNDPAVKARQAARLERVKRKIYRLAMKAAREETQLAACIAFANREEGMPVARVDANTKGSLTVEIVRFGEGSAPE